MTSHACNRYWSTFETAPVELVFSDGRSWAGEIEWVVNWEHDLDDGDTVSHITFFWVKLDNGEIFTRDRMVELMGEDLVKEWESAKLDDFTKSL